MFQSRKQLFHCEGIAEREVVPIDLQVDRLMEHVVLHFHLTFHFRLSILWSHQVMHSVLALDR